MIDGLFEHSDERSRYYRPVGDKCNAQLIKCSACGFVMRPVEQYRMHSACPKCGADRKCQGSIIEGHTRCGVHSSGPIASVESSSDRRAAAVAKRKKRQRDRRNQFRDRAVRERFESAIVSTDMKSLIEETALIVTRLGIVKERITEFGTEKYWNRLRSLAKKAERSIAALTSAVSAGDSVAEKTARDAVEKANAAIYDAISKGVCERDAWDEAMTLAERIAALKKTQSSIERDGKFYLSLSDAMAMTSRIGNAIQSAISQLRAANAKIADLVNDESASRVAEDVCVAASIADDSTREAVKQVIFDFVASIPVANAIGVVDGVGENVLSAVRIAR